MSNTNLTSSYSSAMLLSWSRKACAKSLHVLILSVLGIALTRAMPSISIILYFGEVSFSLAMASIATFGEISDASISWPFSLLEV